MTVKITVYGLVQGVGFRPFVQRTAEHFNLKGNVKNIGGIVEIFINADNKILDSFIKPKPKLLPNKALIHLKLPKATTVMLSP